MTLKFKNHKSRTPKPGDKVKIRDDLVLDTTYGSDGFVSGMDILLGKQATIKYIQINNKFELVEDGGEWNWTKEMTTGEILK